MAAWAKMVFAVALLALPGGIPFLVAVALGRAYRARLQELRRHSRSRMNLLHALLSLRVRDILAEARQMSGWPARGARAASAS